MQTVEFSPREAKVVAEALLRLRGYTSHEMERYLRWSEADQQAWASATSKMVAAAEGAVV